MSHGIGQTVLRALVPLLASVVSACSRAAEPPRLLVPGHDVAIDRHYFGLFVHEVDHGRRWPDVTFGSLRLWDAGVNWSNLQPSRTRWDFRRLDAYVQQATTHGVDIVLPLALSPAWASARPRERSAYGAGMAAEPREITAWQQYVRRIGERYRGRIRFYNVWDEPNQSTFFSGDLDALVELACEAHRIIKEVDPEAQLVSPPPTSKDQGIAWLDEYLAAGGAECADIVGFNFFTWEADQPEETGRLALAVREVMAKHGLADRELWNTGTGRYIANARAPNADVDIVLGDERAAAYVIRTFAVMAAGGIRRSFWYAWDNGYMGLIEPDTRAHKAAARAYETVARWLTGAVVERCERADNDLWRCAMRKRDRAALLLWVPDGRQIMIAWPAGYPNGYRFATEELAPATAELLITETPLLLTTDGRWWDD